MLDIRKRHSLERERALAAGIREVVAELRLVEVADYIAFLRLEHYGNIADIINSSSELYLKPGVLRFANSGSVDVAWGRQPILSLSLEFAHAGVVAHFVLELAAAAAAVDITYISFEEPDPDPDVNTERLRQAIRDAKLKPTVDAAN